MKKLLLVLCLILSLGLTGTLGEETRFMTAAEVQARMEENAYLNLFDLRDETVYNEGHIVGALCFPLASLRTDIQRVLDAGFSYMEAEIIVYGQDAAEGEEAARILGELGFTNVRSLGALSEWTGALISTEEEIALQRQLMTDFNTVDIYGNNVTAELLSGYKLTMVNVWATYCNPCINEMPDLAKLSKEWAEKGVQVVGLLSDATDSALTPSESKIELAQQIAQATKADYPHLLPSQELYQKVLSQVSAVPTTFFVDETGTMVGEVYVGSRSYAAWNEIIQQLLEKQP